MPFRCSSSCGSGFRIRDQKCVQKGVAKRRTPSRRRVAHTMGTSLSHLYMRPRHMSHTYFYTTATHLSTRLCRGMPVLPYRICAHADIRQSRVRRFSAIGPSRFGHVSTLCRTDVAPSPPACAKIDTYKTLCSCRSAPVRAWQSTCAHSLSHIVEG